MEKSARLPSKGGCHGDGCQAWAPDAPLRADDGVKREGGGSFINEDKEKEATRPAWSISGLTDRHRVELASEKKKTTKRHIHPVCEQRVRGEKV